MMTVVDQIRERPMTPLQVGAVLICILINFIDGFDVLAIAFAAPEISKEWQLQPSTLGVVFSSGLAGMVLGALFLSPVADRFGRRKLILLCLAVISTGMFTSALAVSPGESVCRRCFDAFRTWRVIPFLFRSANSSSSRIMLSRSAFSFFRWIFEAAPC